MIDLDSFPGEKIEVSRTETTVTYTQLDYSSVYLGRPKKPLDLEGVAIKVLQMKEWSQAEKDIYGWWRFHFDLLCKQADSKEDLLLKLITGTDRRLDLIGAPQHSKYWDAKEIELYLGVKLVP